MTSNSCSKTIKVLHEHVDFMNGMLQKKKCMEKFQTLILLVTHMCFCPITYPKTIINTKSSSRKYGKSNKQGKHNIKTNRPTNLQNKLKFSSKSPLSSMHMLFIIITITLNAKKSFIFLGFKAHPRLKAM